MAPSRPTTHRPSRSGTRFTPPGGTLPTTAPGFAIGAVAIGLFLAPSIVTGYLAAEHLVPLHAATEASVWTNTALNLGAAIANAGAGALISGLGTTAAMLLAGIIAIAASICTPVAHLGMPPAPDGLLTTL